MTLAELKEKFPVGSLIRRIAPLYPTIYIVEGHKNFTYNPYLIVSELGKDEEERATVAYSFFEIIPSKTTEKEINLCPRCSNQMIEKKTDQYGLIKKCSVCGYC